MILIILLVIAIGIIFDMIGASSLTSKESTFHSMNAKKIKGAKETIKLIKNNVKISSICNDIVGDICGIVSGGLGAVLAISVIPYLAYLRCQRIYSEFIFEQIETYTTNVIMEFNTTQSFVKSLEGVRDSGIIEEPVLGDLRKMIDMSYQNGTIDESIDYFNKKYPYYMVKNMHQLFFQITKEGARDAGQSLENMAMDIDALVEGVYRDQMDRKQFHSKFIKFGLALFFLILAVQYMYGSERYIELLDLWYVQIILHAIIIVNALFLLKGEKYYNEDVGVE